MAALTTPYNLTQLGGADSFNGLINFANDVTGDLFVGLFVMAVFVIAVFVLKKYEFDFALLSSSFGAFVISALLSYGGFLNMIYPLAFLAIMAFTAFYVFVIKD